MIRCWYDVKQSILFPKLIYSSHYGQLSEDKLVTPLLQLFPVWKNRMSEPNLLVTFFQGELFEALKGLWTIVCIYLPFLVFVSFLFGSVLILFNWDHLKGRVRVDFESIAKWFCRGVLTVDHANIDVFLVLGIEFTPDWCHRFAIFTPWSIKFEEPTLFGNEFSFLSIGKIDNQLGEIFGI